MHLVYMLLVAPVRFTVCCVCGICKLYDVFSHLEKNKDTTIKSLSLLFVLPEHLKLFKKKLLEPHFNHFYRPVWLVYRSTTVHFIHPATFWSEIAAQQQQQTVS